MRFEKDSLLKPRSRNDHSCCNIRKFFLILGIIVLTTLGAYNYLSINEHEITEVPPWTLEVTEEEDEMVIEAIHPATYINQEEEERRMIEKEFNRRREHVKQVCQNWRLRAPAEMNMSSKPNVAEFYINKKYNLVYCNVFEAASSSWLYKEELELAQHNKAPAKTAKSAYSTPSFEQLEEALNSSLSFLIVRHPFDRLVSAYRDKFIYHQNNPFYVKKGLEIITATRLPSDIELNLDETAIDPSELPPTFEEFTKYIICSWKLGAVLDEHWTPATKSCTPCAVNFDLIIKFETLEKEQLYLINRANLNNIVEPAWENKSPERISKTMIKNYFSQISRRQINDLYQYFKHDFELFEYSPDEYLAYGQLIHRSLPCRTSPGV